jgi:hypothetical protein
MKSVVRPELSTAAVGSSQAPTAAVDNSAPRSTTPESTYKSGKSVQTTGATSLGDSENNGFATIRADAGCVGSWHSFISHRCRGRV